MDRKTFRTGWKNVVDEDQGIVEHIVTVFGIIDLGNDVSHKGSFTKTLQEREKRIRVLDSHNTNSIMSAIGVPLEIREIGRDELPEQVLQKYPEATGGVKATTQYLLDTPEGFGAFARIKSGAVDEYSYGYDTIISDWEDVKTKDDEAVRVRNLREIRLWEYSPVLWGMNQATMTTGVKDGPKDEPEAEPVEDPKDELVDEPAGSAATEPEKAVGNDVLVRSGDYGILVPAGREHLAEKFGRLLEVATSKEMVNGMPHKRLGDVMNGVLHRTFTDLADGWYIAGLFGKAERILMSNAIGDALSALDAKMPEAIANMDLTQIESSMFDFWMGADGPEGAKVGRAISARNEERIRSAVNALVTLLQDTGIYEQDGETDEDLEGEDDAAPVKEAAADVENTGPEETTPPDDGEDQRRLKLLELEELELSLLEV